jgi:hypothetical protein
MDQYNREGQFEILMILDLYLPLPVLMMSHYPLYYPRNELFISNLKVNLLTFSVLLISLFEFFDEKKLEIFLPISNNQRN